ncbi:MAG: hypothetical protein ACOCUR_00315, partial [Nanoarchaeota archaeon]
IDDKNDRKFNEELLDTILRSTISHHDVSRPEDKAGLEENKLHILSRLKDDIAGYPNYLKRIVERDFRYRNLRGTDEASKILDEIILVLDADSEYQKLRAFVGYETDYGSDWQKKKQQREDLLKHFVQTIDESNVAEWITYLTDLSKLYVGDQGIIHKVNYFLNELGKTKPELGDKFLAVADLNQFQVALMDGLLRSKDKQKYQSKISEFIDKGEMLSDIAATYRFVSDYEDALFSKLVAKIIESNNVESLLILLDTVCKNFSSKKSTKDQFLAIIRKLTELKYYDWAHRVSYICEDVVNSLTLDEYADVLDNLSFKKYLSYDSETILLPLIAKSPTKIIDFFNRRVTMRVAGNDLIDAIPHSLQRLSEPLSEKVDLIVPEILKWFDADDWKFRWEAGHLLNIIFKTIDGRFKEILLAEIKTKDKQKLNKVIWILNKYEGTLDVLSIVKEIILNHKMSSDLRKDLFAILSSMGVVMGEYGIADAYQRKITEITPWLTDENKDISSFAKDYITYLENNIKVEKARVEKEKDLRTIEFERTKPQDDETSS